MTTIRQEQSGRPSRQTPAFLRRLARARAIHEQAVTLAGLSVPPVCCTEVALLQSEAASNLFAGSSTPSPLGHAVLPLLPQTAAASCDVIRSVHDYPPSKGLSTDKTVFASAAVAAALSRVTAAGVATVVSVAPPSVAPPSVAPPSVAPPSVAPQTPSPNRLQLQHDVPMELTGDETESDDEDVVFRRCGQAQLRSETYMAVESDHEQPEDYEDQEDHGDAEQDEHEEESTPKRRRVLLPGPARVTRPSAKFRKDNDAWSVTLHQHLSAKHATHAVEQDVTWMTSPLVSDAVLSVGTAASTLKPPISSDPEWLQALRCGGIGLFTAALCGAREDALTNAGGDVVAGTTKGTSTLSSGVSTSSDSNRTCIPKGWAEFQASSVSAPELRIAMQHLPDHVQKSLQQSVQTAVDTSVDLPATMDSPTTTTLLSAIHVDAVIRDVNLSFVSTSDDKPMEFCTYSGHKRKVDAFRGKHVPVQYFSNSQVRLVEIPLAISSDQLSRCESSRCESSRCESSRCESDSDGVVVVDACAKQPLSANLHTQTNATKTESTCVLGIMLPKASRARHEAGWFMAGGIRQLRSYWSKLQVRTFRRLSVPQLVSLSMQTIDPMALQKDGILSSTGLPAVQQVLHTTSLSVGIAAAASGSSVSANGSTSSSSSSSSLSRLTMDCSHPFFFYVRHLPSQRLVLTGEYL